MFNMAANMEHADTVAADSTGKKSSKMQKEDSKLFAPMTGGFNYARAMESSSESDPVDVKRVSDADENAEPQVGVEFDAVANDYTCKENSKLDQIDTEIISPIEENEIMVRQRKNMKKGGRDSDASRESSETNGQQPPSTANSRRSSRAKSRGKSSPLGIRMIAVVGFLVACLVVMWLYYQQMLASRVNTPLGVPRVIASDEGSIQPDADRFWGTYRPGVYFGKLKIYPACFVALSNFEIRRDVTCHDMIDCVLPRVCFTLITASNSVL